ncbi:uncharacterized protein F5147DRAFT_791288 [Suillus discolor]|uniref:Uncharacterized protein n=1 Tax=Suillus discolor TaxID=1912936 RepID=A0A9P7JWL5_9AGAM|nr:uncharacterized protein F5147DRAFT_791288 [Suillus discolor]KAG2112592.1 hypothetical protein F5147DRAFT_791288 [Suillus discolor]
MATNSVATLPPRYEFESPSVDSIQCTGKPSIFSFMQKREKRAIVLSRIRDIVSAPNFSSSSIVPTVNTCAAAISPAEFSKLLQKRNIEGHTAMYWAIVNHRREALWAFVSFITRFSSACVSDLRLACMLTSDHALFAKRNLARVIGSSKDESFRKFLGCPPDEVQIHDTGDGMCKIQFNVCFRIGMFRKRLLTKRKFGKEFVAAGRIWSLRMSSVAPDGFCRIHLKLSDESLPTRLDAVLVIEAHSGKPGCEIPPQDLRKPNHPDDFTIPQSPIGYAGRPLERTRIRSLSSSHGP